MTPHQDLWSAKLPNGEVRAGTIEQLGEAFRAGLVGEGTLVCAAGSDQWARLSDILGLAAGAVAAPASGPAPGSSVPPRPSTAPRPSTVPRPSAAPVPAPAAVGGELWQVRLASGEVRSGTRAQLEEAFASGHLTADLPALSTGATSWRPLALALAGSVSIRPPAPATAAPSYAPPPARPAPSSAPRPPAPASDDAWQVKLPDGQVRAGTRAQLEEAVRAGHLDASAMVLPAGATEWAPLHVVVAALVAAPAQALAPQPAVMPHAEVAPPAELAPPADVAPQAELAPPPAVAPADTETPLAADTTASLPAGTPGEDTPVTDAAASAEPLWQVKLLERQIQAALEAGLLGEDVLVMEAGTDQWVRFGDVRRSRAESE
jgi:hypothetical protein